ncbi:DUF4132 domain-containing protein [Streptomyces sp. NPDC001941]|uniref:DUF4132 domain-containing protein n=1 Tax=Streptomyces sp. NPDC001941 TaxID=3154659 RepID=UPI003321BF52
MEGTTGLGTRLYEAGVRQRTQGGAAVRELLGSLDPGGRRWAALWIHRTLCHADADRAGSWEVPWLAGQRLGWSGAEADELFARLVGAGALVDPGTLLRRFGALVALPLAAAREAGDADRMLLRAARTASLSAWGGQDEDGENARIRAELDALIGPEADDGTGLERHLLDDEDAFGPRVRAAHTALLARPGVAALLAHCRDLDRARPSGRWRARAAELLARVPGGDELARTVLSELAAQPEHQVVAPRPFGVERRRGIAGDANERLARGLVWASADLAREWVVPVLGELALNAGTGRGGSGGECRAPRVAAAAVAVLGAREGDEAGRAVEWLGRLRHRVRNRTLAKAVGRSLEAVAARRGLTPSMLAERGVPTAGLDARGMREEPLGAYTAVLSVAPAGAALTFRGPEGRVLKSAPKEVREAHGERLAEVKEALKRLRALLPVERARLEEHLVAGTRWPAGDWERYYVDHPVTGALARSLVWEARSAADDGWTAGLPERTGGGWALADPDGTALPVGGAGTVLRLWHPARAVGERSGEVRSWLEEAAARALRQPFPQVRREVYGTGPAGPPVEVDHPRLRALLAERRWAGGHLGYFTEGYAAEVVRELPRPGETAPDAGGAWRAVLELRLVGRGAADGVTRCVLGGPRFEHRPGPGADWEPVAAERVPRVGRSEVLRDVGLFTRSAGDEQQP